MLAFTADLGEPDYLSENNTYINATVDYGTISPQALFDAFLSLATPPLTTKESHLIKAALKAKPRLSTKPTIDIKE